MIETFLDKLQMHGFQSGSITYQEEKSNTLRIKERRLFEKHVADDGSYIIEANKDGKTVKLNVAHLDERDMEEYLSKLSHMATLLELETPLVLQERCHIQETFSCKHPFDEESTVTSLLDAVQNASDELIQDIDITFERKLQKMTIQNTCETSLHSEKEVYSLDIGVVAKKDDQKASSYATWLSGQNNFDFVSLIRECAEDAKAQLTATTMKTGTYRVLFSHAAVDTLLSHFIPYFSGTAIYDKTSILTDKVGKKIASSLLSLEERPTDHSFAGVTPFDDEGTKTYDKFVVKEGVFETVLTDHQAAFQLQCKETGNAYGQITTRNLCMKPGVFQEEELLRQLEDGVYITSIYGANSGIEEATGTISTPCLGYLVKKGKKEESVKDFILTTNFLELFSSVVAFGKEQRQQRLSCVVVPMLVDDIHLSA